MKSVSERLAESVAALEPEAIPAAVRTCGEDFDDTFEGGPVHSGAVIVPAVLAACERFGRDGGAVFTNSGPRRDISTMVQRHAGTS